jgi:hypothetical protein
VIARVRLPRAGLVVPAPAPAVAVVVEVRVFLALSDVAGLWRDMRVSGTGRRRLPFGLGECARTWHLPWPLRVWAVVGECEEKVWQRHGAIYAMLHVAVSAAGAGAGAGAGVSQMFATSLTPIWTARALWWWYTGGILVGHEFALTYILPKVWCGPRLDRGICKLGV